MTMTEAGPQSTVNTGELVRDSMRPSLLLDVAARDHNMDLAELWTQEAERQHALPEQQAEVIDNGLGVHFDQISLYHGGPIRNIKQFDLAEEYTIGKGFYTTSTPAQAFGYAQVRSENRQTATLDSPDTKAPTVYEALATNISFVDLRKQENIKPTLDQFADYLEQWLATQAEAPAGKSVAQEGYLRDVQHKIAQMRLGKTKRAQLHSGNLKEVLHQVGDQFTDYITGLGYDGIIAYEGGEAGITGEHDSWVIMHPEKVRVTKELSFENPDVTDSEVWQKQMDDTRSIFPPWPADAA